MILTALLAAGFGGLWWWRDRATPGGLTGGSFVGLWYGVAGSLLMALAGLLSRLHRAPSCCWIGSRQAWLRGHIWLGLLSVLFILCHSGFRIGGPLTLALWSVFLLTIVTGAFGLVLQQFLPRQITTRVPCESPYEQIPHLCQKFREQVDDLVEQVNKKTNTGQEASILITQRGMRAVVQFQDFYERTVRPFLHEEYQRASVLANPAKAEA